MKITQLRNATLAVEINSCRILIDPMLACKDALPPLRIFDGKQQRNPTVELPIEAEPVLDSVTHCLITHCQKGHFDHLDRAGTQWLRERQIPVICTPHDAPHLRKRSLNVHSLPSEHDQVTPFLGGRIRTVRCTHGKGLIGMMMEHGVGYLIEMPGEPTLYLAGDTILTPRVRDFVLRHQPEISVVPAGGARFDIGHDIIMGIDEVIEFTQLATGMVVANHLEALSHCPVQRVELAAAAVHAGIAARLHIPQDGESLEFSCGTSQA